MTDPSFDDWQGKSAALTLRAAACRDGVRQHGGRLSAQTPFGGMKQSGFGRDLSLHSFDKYTAFKTPWIQYKI